MMTVQLQLQHVHQSAEGYCLPACVQMVLAYLDMSRSETAIQRLLGTRFIGTPSFAVKRLSQWGLKVTYREWSVSQLLEALQNDQPVILFVRTGFLDHWQYDVAHAVVVSGYEENRQFWMHDPALATGPIAVSWQGVLAAWAEFGCRGAVIQ